MNSLTLENFGVVELSQDESKELNGGNPILIGIGIGVGAIAVYDFINGVYTGIKTELAKA